MLLAVLRAREGLEQGSDLAIRGARGKSSCSSTGGLGGSQTGGRETTQMGLFC